jgi:deoxyribonuclease V
MIPPQEYETLSIAQAIAYQQELRKQVNIVPLHTGVRVIGGADISFNKYSETVFAGIVVLSYPQLKIIEQVTVHARTKFPYIPGLLAFREVPALLQVWEKIRNKPDVMILDGQGIAHERRTGIATHFGLLTDIPSIGCAKSRLAGSFDEPGNRTFDQSPIWDGNEQVGVALRSKPDCKPLYISPGHGITIGQSLEIVSKCIRRHRVPEPTRLAHLLVNKVRIADGNNSSPGTLFD